MKEARYRVAALLSRRERADDDDETAEELKASGIPRTRVMGDEEGTVIQFGKSQWVRRGGPWTDPGGTGFKAFYREFYAPPLCSGRHSSVLSLLLHHCPLPTGSCACFLDKE